MSEYFNLLFSPLHGGTILLYTLIFIVASILGNKVQYVTRNGQHIFSMKFFICLFLFLCAFYVFNDVGIDTDHYRTYYLEFVTPQDVADHYGAVEKLYQYLNIVLHVITYNEYIGVGIIRFIQLAILFVALYKLRNRINIGLAIMAYMAFFYYDSFNLLRSSLAGSICLLGMAFLYEKKIFITLALALLAYGIHHSAIFFVVTLLLYIICYHTPIRKFKKVVPVVAVFALFVVLNIGANIINQLLAADFANGRYDYVESHGSVMGIFILLKYSIPFLILHLVNKSKENNYFLDSAWDIDFIWTIVGFALALLAYQIGMLTRAAIYFSSSFIFLLPNYIYTKESISRTNVTKFIFVFVLYFMFMYITTIGNLYNISELGPFKFI